VVRKLGVNIDHVATIRQARGAPYPDPVAAALVAEIAGAHQITCHLRGDRRHIQDSDLVRLAASVQTCLNVELAATDEMVDIACRLLGGSGRHRVTLVPERQGEVTTEGGLDVTNTRAMVHKAVTRLRDAKIGVSLFIDPEETQVRASTYEHVDMVELNTARYAEGVPGELERLRDAARATLAQRAQVAAGHGLTTHNLRALVEGVPEISEYNIGHSIVAQAVFVGMDRAVRDVLELLR
jgi:pyridoxine 5-phosphate synthase